MRANVVHGIIGALVLVHAPTKEPIEGPHVYATGLVALLPKGDEQVSNRVAIKICQARVPSEHSWHPNRIAMGADRLGRSPPASKVSSQLLRRSSSEIGSGR